MEKELCEFATKENKLYANQSSNGYACKVMFECRYGPEKERAEKLCPRYEIGIKRNKNLGE